MAMKLLSLIFIFTIFTIQPISQSIFDKWDECFRKCGGEFGELESQRNGTRQCFEDEDSSTETMSPCIVDCLGAQLPNDQQECFCKVCKRIVSRRHGKKDGFCSAPGGGAINSVTECENTVCVGKGNLRYYGPWCDPKRKKELEEMIANGDMK